MEKYILIPIYLILLFYHVEIAPSGKWQSDILSRDHEKPLRGFLSVTIMIHHMVQQLTSPGYLMVFNEVGLLCVAAFFFFSGYGLMYQTRRNQNYLSIHYFARYIYLLVPFWFSNIFYVLYAFLTGRTFSIKGLFASLIGFDLINTNAWFIISIGLFYLVYYVIFRMISHYEQNSDGIFSIQSKKAGTIVLLFIQILYMMLCMARGSGTGWFQGEWWFNSCILFSIGAILCLVQERFIAFCQKYYRVLFPASIILFFYCWTHSIDVLDQISYLAADSTIFSPALANSYRCLFTQITAVISFVFCVFLGTFKIKVDNRVLRFLSSIALELYLIHGIFVQLFHSSIVYVENDGLYMVLVVVCSIGSAWILKRPVMVISKFIDSKINIIKVI